MIKWGAGLIRTRGFSRGKSLWGGYKSPPSSISGGRAFAAETTVEPTSAMNMCYILLLLTLSVAVFGQSKRRVPLLTMSYVPLPQLT